MPRHFLKYYMTSVLQASLKHSVQFFCAVTSVLQCRHRTHIACNWFGMYIFTVSTSMRTDFSSVQQEWHSKCSMSISSYSTAQSLLWLHLLRVVQHPCSAFWNLLTDIQYVYGFYKRPKICSNWAVSASGLNPCCLNIQACPLSVPWCYQVARSGPRHHRRRETGIVTNSGLVAKSRICYSA